MNVKQLGTARFEGQDLPYGIIAELANGRQIVVCGGFLTVESAIVNIGAILGKYATIFFYNNEYPSDDTQEPGPYSLRGCNAQWNDTAVIERRTYWTPLNEYVVLRWYNHRSIIID